MSDNSWFECDELPPVGIFCLQKDDKSKFVEVEILAHRCGFCIGWCKDHSMAYLSDDRKDFLPLRTEREKAISAALKVVDASEGSPLASWLGQLYDAGLLRLPY